MSFYSSTSGFEHHQYLRPSGFHDRHNPPFINIFLEPNQNQLPLPPTIVLSPPSSSSEASTTLFYPVVTSSQFPQTNDSHRFVPLPATYSAAMEAARMEAAMNGRRYNWSMTILGGNELVGVAKLVLWKWSLLLDVLGRIIIRSFSYFYGDVILLKRHLSFLLHERLLALYTLYAI